MGDLPVGHANGPSGNEAWPNFCPCKGRDAGKAGCPMHLCAKWWLGHFAQPNASTPSRSWCAPKRYP